MVYINDSREMFNKWQAQRWWEENADKVMELYNVQRLNRQALPVPTLPRSEDEVQNIKILFFLVDSGRREHKIQFFAIRHYPSKAPAWHPLRIYQARAAVQRQKPHRWMLLQGPQAPLRTNYP